MTSLLDVAKAMNTEAVEGTATLSLIDGASAANSTAKVLTLMDVAQHETHSSQDSKKTLEQVAQDCDHDDRVKIQVALQSAANDVKIERQVNRSQTFHQTAAQVEEEELQAVAVLQAKVACVDQAKHNADDSVSKDDDDEGYSSFEEESPEKAFNKVQEPVMLDEEDPADVGESYDPLIQTTTSESKESKEFVRAVYRADKYQIRDMLENDVVDVNVADQHGWSGLHWAASQNHSEILKFLLQKGAKVNAIDQMNGWTALHVAVVQEAASCVSILLSSGADPRIRDKYDDTVVECLQAASTKNKRKMLQCLHETHSNNSK